MTPEERDQQLRDRMDELAASLEQQSRTAEERHRQYMAQFALIAQQIEALTQNSQILHDSIKSLENIATAEEERISDIEDQEPGDTMGG